MRRREEATGIVREKRGKRQGIEKEKGGQPRRFGGENLHGARGDCGRSGTTRRVVLQGRCRRTDVVVVVVVVEVVVGVVVVVVATFSISISSRPLTLGF